jgi:hypothetical protein
MDRDAKISHRISEDIFLLICLKNNLKTVYTAHIGIDSFRIMKLIFFKTEVSFSNTTRTEEKKPLVNWRGCFAGEAVPRSHGLSFILKTPHRRLHQERLGLLGQYSK